MSAVYVVRWAGKSRQPGEWYASLEATDLETARETAADAIGMGFPFVEISDGWMAVARWEGGTEQEGGHEAPGHPAGCSCGECESRASHAAGSHEADLCAEHGRCRKCGQCATCDQYDAEARYLVTVVDRLGDRVTDAMAEVAKAEKALQELTTSLYDIELVESSDGVDLGADLADATRSLRRARRIVEARKHLLGD